MWERRRFPKLLWVGRQLGNQTSVSQLDFSPLLYAPFSNIVDIKAQRMPTCESDCFPQNSGKQKRTKLCENNRETLRWVKRKKIFQQAQGHNGGVLSKRGKNYAFSSDQCRTHGPARQTRPELLPSVFLKCHFTFSQCASCLMSGNYVCTVSGIMWLSVCNID